MLNCIKCGRPQTDFSQDSRGCEFFKKVDETGLTTEEIFICSICISDFQYVQDLPQIQKEAYEFYSGKFMPVIDALFKV